MCGRVDLGCHVKEGIQSIAKSGLEELLFQLNQAASDAMHSMATFWIEVPEATIATGSGQTWEETGPVAYLHNASLSVVLSVFTLAIIAAGIRTAWEQRAKPLQELLKAMLIFVLVCGAGSATLQLLTDWSDDLALEIVAGAAGGDVEAGLNAMVSGVGASEAGVATGQLLLQMGLMTTAIIASVIQIVLLLIRSAMLVLLAGTFPLAAAATNTEVGRMWFRKYCGWSLAFIAYKPAAALIYAAAMKLNESAMLPSDDQLVTALTGLMMLLLAVFALPALLRFAVPLSAAVAGGSAGMGSSVADPGGLASGAINVGRSRLSRGGGGGAGAGGGGASGARTVGSAGLGAAGAALTAARKAGGAVSGAASHSAGEEGGGGSTPTSIRPSGSGGGGGPSGASGGGRSRSSGGGRSSAPRPNPSSGSDPSEYDGPGGGW